MLNLFVRYSYIWASIVFSALLMIIIGGSCSSPTEPWQNNENEFPEQLEADIAHAVLKSDGSVWVWGRNWSGQLGNGSLESNPVPAKVLNLENVVAIKLYEGIAVAADIKGNIWFWGDRVIWLESAVTTPTKISVLKGTISIQIRGGDIDLLRNDGTVWRLDWDHTSPKKFLQPKKVAGLKDIKAISGHLALKENGTICLLDDDWISPEWGGYIPGIDNVIAIQNRWKTHTIILKEDSTVWAWGKNRSGTLGNGTFEGSNKPVQVKNLQNIITISTNGAQCLALRNDGTVWFWGLIELNLDENKNIGQSIPLKIDNLDNVTLIHAGGAVESIVKKNDNTYWIFGFKDRILKKVSLPE